jgi:DNA-binding transcriptional MerR regulator
MEEGNNVFSIKDLEIFSGIKAHTIRIWEKRYKILAPERTDSNIRTYSESELKKILNVAYLNRNGIKISKIAILDEDELTQQVITVSSKYDNKDSDFQPGKILMSAIRFTEELFKETLSKFIISKGLEEAYPNYFYPLLEKARILWQTANLSRAQEQFIRYTIRQLIIVEDHLLKHVSVKNSKTVAMINTSDGLTENNFLFYKYILKKRGYDVIFAGGVLPASEAIEIYKIKPFDFLVVNSHSFDFAKNQLNYFNSIVKSLMIKNVIFTDSDEQLDKKLNSRLLMAKDPHEFIRLIEKLS